jgi:uncharacterized protein YlxP (DUF503 family)
MQSFSDIKKKRSFIKQIVNAVSATYLATAKEVSILQTYSFFTKLYSTVELTAAYRW